MAQLQSREQVKKEISVKFNIHKNMSDMKAYNHSNPN